jgi:uncharacterized phage infection (PIP) family protein YhgE
MQEHVNIQKLVNNFVSDLQAIFQRSAIAALTNGNSKAKLHSSGSRSGSKRSADELDQLADSFVKYVNANPNLRIEQINKALGTTTKELALPIRKLIAEKRVRTKGSKRSTTYAVIK